MWHNKNSFVRYANLVLSMIVFKNVYTDKIQMYIKMCWIEWSLYAISTVFFMNLIKTILSIRTFEKISRWKNLEIMLFTLYTRCLFKRLSNAEWWNRCYSEMKCSQIWVFMIQLKIWFSVDIHRTLDHKCMMDALIPK